MWLVTIVVITALTDLIDGWWARKFNCISDFGKIHDPLADKWIVTIYLPLVMLGMIHFLPVALLWIRDITSTYVRSQSNKIIPARTSGKIKSFISFPLLCLLTAAIPVEGSYFGFLVNINEFLYYFGGILLSIVCVWSGFDYYYQIIIKK